MFRRDRYDETQDFRYEGIFENCQWLHGPVYIVDSDGRKENINKEYGIQVKLQAEYQRNRKILSLCLEVPTPEDYMSIVNYYVGDC